MRSAVVVGANTVEILLRVTCSELLQVAQHTIRMLLHSTVSRNQCDIPIAESRSTQLIGTVKEQRASANKRLAVQALFEIGWQQRKDCWNKLSLTAGPFQKRYSHN
jgi:hypothetical protein